MKLWIFPFSLLFSYLQRKFMIGFLNIFWRSVFRHTKNCVVILSHPTSSSVKMFWASIKNWTAERRQKFAILTEVCVLIRITSQRLLKNSDDLYLLKWMNEWISKQWEEWRKRWKMKTTFFCFVHWLIKFLSLLERGKCNIKNFN